MANKFDLASIIREQGGPKLTPDAPDLRRISIDLIDSNEGNFYSIENVKDLMDSISVSGVLQPILVNSKADGRYLLIAGHRRTKATKLLRDAWDGEGENPYSTIPAIVKSAARNERESLLDELALIQTNAAVRKLSDPELAKQADRMTEILYRLKNLGYPFPGRMRETVAKAVGVSSSKIGRLKTIREHLTPEWLKRWEAGKLSESGAEALAKLRPEVQDALLSWKAVMPDRTNGIEKFYDLTHTEQDCEVKKGFQCDHLETLWEKGMMAISSWERCPYATYSNGGQICCSDCNTLKRCKSACKLAKDAAAKSEKLAVEKRKRDEMVEIERAQETWRRLDELIAAHGVSREEADKLLGVYFGISKHLSKLGEDSDMNAYALSRTVEQACGFKGVYQLAKRMGLPPEAITDPDWASETTAPEPDERFAGLVLVPKETESGTVWDLADPKDFVPVGRWYPADGDVFPEDGQICMILREIPGTGTLWQHRPQTAVCRAKRFISLINTEVIFRDVRYWSLWPDGGPDLSTEETE